MTENTVSEIERMVVTRVFDAPRELVWKAWTDPKYVMQWWGPKGFTAPVCEMDFRVGGKFLCCMKSPDGQEFWNAVEYHEIVPYEKIVSLMYFSDSKGNKIEPAQLGIEHEAIEGAYDVRISETARRNLPSLEMNPWRARKIAVKWRAGTRYSINLLRLLRGWYRRNRKLTF